MSFRGGTDLQVKNAGVLVGRRGTINLSGFTVADDAANREIDISAGGVISHTEFNAAVAIAAVTEGTATTIVTAPAYNSDGVTPISIEFFAPSVDMSAISGNDDDFWIALYQDGASIGVLGRWKFLIGAANTISTPVHLRRRLIPAAGARTYSIRGWRDEATMSVTGGAGGAGLFVPGYIRLSRD